MLNFGIDDKEVDMLCDLDNIKLIEKYKNEDPAKLALRGVSHTLCTQIKFLQKCKQKIPHYADVTCIIPPVSYEQCSSTLSLIAKKESGGSMLDLTCGLGVDTFHYSGRFDYVTSLEREDILAKVAKENFRRLGANNITVINTSCEDFILNYNGSKFDMVYVDPARRDESKRVFMLEDCSPDILSLLSDIKRITSCLVIKLSPLFDYKEAFRVFGESGVTCRTVSVAGECKELIVSINFDDTTSHGKREIAVVTTGGELFEFTCGLNESTHIKNSLNNPLEGNYIYLMDAAIRKMRCEASYANFCIENNKENCLYVDNDIIISDKSIANFAGRQYEIEQIVDFKPKQFKNYGINSATIVKQNFPMSVEDIRRQLKLKDAGRRVLIFTTLYGERKIIITK